MEGIAILSMPSTLVSLKWHKVCERHLPAGNLGASLKADCDSQQVDSSLHSGSLLLVLPQL